MEENFGGPVWHVSVQDQIGGLPATTVRGVAYDLLDGYGDAAAGEWTQMPGRIFHLRRRLSPSEASLVGPVVDVRGTPEAARRIAAVRRWVVDAGVEQLAEEELTLGVSNGRDTTSTASAVVTEPTVGLGLRSVPEAAAILTVSPRTVWKWVQSGELEHYRLGRNVRISDAQIADFLEGRRQRSVAEPTDQSDDGRYSENFSQCRPQCCKDRVRPANVVRPENAID